MIVTVTLNPALDLTYPVDALVPHHTHRVTAVSERAGGKGLNVARVLHALGEPVLATGLLGGPTGGVVAGLLDAEGVPASFSPITGGTRRTVAVVDREDATGFWEPGPIVSPAEWLRFVDHFRGLIGRASVVTLCGSLPPGLPIDAYGVLTRAATEAGVPVLLDTSGPALREGLAAGPAVTKPNASELAALIPDWDVGALRALTSGAVVVTDGVAGLRAITPDAEFRCAPPVPVAGNPTGAGDACAAALARGLRDRTAWPSLLVDAVALGAAAVASPVAGAFDPAVYQEMLVSAGAAAARPGSLLGSDRAGC
ncbi:1-phosphofructokinase family hexose kinase [Actinoplanes sp. L3-i22]|uniref:1-phosphofructokinase family hexose kinase n=1 Tax=Actinoplanes sp. L3-i22 TaxID=2836373 RepID=UPI001C756A56|nr:hexose kinase [Actinoplanes sp. L3-i22]BCY11962.1 sugar kinase [Actinoplanes sp. L3-i22]